MDTAELIGLFSPGKTFSGRAWSCVCPGDEMNLKGV